ncbi:uncharacterized protein BX663DRAFT_497058 [Cokeromyces recurvatus]|uniref:uncharacterized protein n=1 Tax=Cokeromyces recurvatus TaxID=90255 RepID=UPI0022208914|nr:uncharacterized protein BX663DRAFT_497058 [Cokeromyces recurvatus]KAI7906604.1 hypothetical protein BX663DRAFT_497058 [Cokeromyces recurvatus]
MPVPVEYSSIRRMSTITIPKQDINFDAYDFQLCVPQNDIKDAFESKDLEASFCRDFACCGLVLEDLHDLLQHYEECHVRIESDDGSFFDEEDAWSSPSLSFASLDDSVPTSPAAAYLSDLYNTTHEEQKQEEVEEKEKEKEKVKSSQETTTSAVKKTSNHNHKKRTYSQYSSSHHHHQTPSALDLLTQSAVKKLAMASSSLNGGDVPTPILTDEEFLAQAGALLASANSIFSIDANNADKPYKCPVSGCDKAYKNPNGLKYHNQHGHCNLIEDDSDSLSKPYQCTIGECGKRYKNLNGLKYHIEHSHMAVLNQTLASFSSTLFNSSNASF